MEVNIAFPGLGNTGLWVGLCVQGTRKPWQGVELRLCLRGARTDLGPLRGVFLGQSGL